MKNLKRLILLLFIITIPHLSSANKTQVTHINVDEFNKMLNNDDAFIVDVCIPEKKHIAGTDAFIPYNKISSYIDTLPSEDAPIIVYCEGGDMSAEAAEQLVHMGYQKVYNLKGGCIAWENKGFKVDGPDKIIFMNAQRFYFTPKKIKIKQGKEVEIITESKDVEHGFAIPEFNINKTIYPNKRNIIKFTASKKGKITFYCSVACGNAYNKMKGKIIIY